MLDLEGVDGEGNEGGNWRYFTAKLADFSFGNNVTKMAENNRK